MSCPRQCLHISMAMLLRVWLTYSFCDVCLSGTKLLTPEQWQSKPCHQTCWKQNYSHLIESNPHPCNQRFTHKVSVNGGKFKFNINKETNCHLRHTCGKPFHSLDGRLILQRHYYQGSIPTTIPGSKFAPNVQPTTLKSHTTIRPFSDHTRKRMWK